MLLLLRYCYCCFCGGVVAALAMAADIWLAPHFCWSVPISRLWVWAAEA